jgi:hypothetical protein
MKSTDGIMKYIYNNGRITLYLIVLFLVLDLYTSHPCGMEFLKKPERVLLKQENDSIRMLKSEDWEPIRIHLDFSMIENNIGKFSKKDLTDLKEKIMPKTKEVFEKLLKVKRSKSMLKLPYENCDQIRIPEIYQKEGEGVDADLVIFVLIDDSGFFLKNKVEAAAIHCFQNFETRRPISGYIQFKPELNVNDPAAVDYMVWLALHEITHILVMNDALYEDWIDVDMKPLGLKEVIKKKILPNGKVMNMIKTPKILAIGKEHYGCESFEGLPLEYNGGPGTAGAHWAKKYMNTDYMIGDSYGENLISKLSLAMFEDSGWYKVDYSTSNLFLWGKNKGCDFLDNNVKCVSGSNNKIETKFKDEFCTKLNAPVCSTSHIFRATCKTRKYNFLHPSERYFDDETAGIDSLCDKCPIAIEAKHGQSYYGGSCQKGQTQTLNNIEKVCPECACFMSSLKELTNSEAENVNKRRLLRFKQVALAVYISDNVNEIKVEMPQQKIDFNNINNSNNSVQINYKLQNDDTHNTEYADLKASCYEFNCEGSDLYVLLKDKKIKCDKEHLEIEGYEGHINCPDSKILCDEKYKCTFGCIDKN